MQGGLTGAALFMTPLGALAAKKGPNIKYKPSKGALLDFTPVAIAKGNGPNVVVSSDYEYQTLIPWGTPIKPGVPTYGGTGPRPSSADQANQIGIGHDGMWLFPDRARGRTSSKGGMLAINHEFGRNTHVLGKSQPESLEDVKLSQHAHGVSVVRIEEHGGLWDSTFSPNNRRIHVNTPVTFSGPAAGHPLLGNPVRASKGTVNNCSSGYTPWGTYPTCEENFNGYFGSTEVQALFPQVLAEVTEEVNNDPTIPPEDKDEEIADRVDDRLQEIFNETATDSQKRYGFSYAGFGYGWERFDDRFDLSNPAFEGEENRFGWVVEIDPNDGSQVPVKRTALGRVKHEGAEVTVGRGGRAVVYMGDDQRFDYIYKFVSADNWKSMVARGISPLDEGTLYVARFDDDGTGVWLPLTVDNPALSGLFADQGELLVNTRLAADAVGATPMDRPEWCTVAPDESVYCTLTNNSRRTVPNAANPLAPNADGHIIRWKDSAKHTGTTFTWDIYLFAKDTHPDDRDDTFSDPDGIWADPDGRVFIETDGGQKKGLNNQLLVSNPETGEIRRLLTGVTDDEITGLTVTPDRRTLFCNTQHPGNGDPTKTNFPAPTDGTTIPRDCTIVLRRKDGGIVGS
jgi:secreted PhoX family phosphatase